ncbi:MAG: DUF4765 family protein, partial [Prevotella sp.]|nr:DUF4765 family protein [Prevotella sp.]
MVHAKEEVFWEKLARFLNSLYLCSRLFGVTKADMNNNNPDPTTSLISEQAHLPVAFPHEGSASGFSESPSLQGERLRV